VSKGTIANGMPSNSICYERGNLQLGTV